jgi:hypothetical protein
VVKILNFFKKDCFNHGKYSILRLKSRSLNANLNISCVEYVQSLKGLTQEGEVTGLGAGSTINYISQQWLSASSYHIRASSPSQMNLNGLKF